MRLFFIVPTVFSSLSMALSTLNFINPLPFGTAGDFTKNPIYTVGSTVNIVWNGAQPDEATSVTLWQFTPNGTNYIFPLEYITQSQVNVTNFSWIVATNKNLTYSNLFFLSIFREGGTTSDANSHYFNITQSETTTTPDPSSTTTTTTKSSSSLPSETFSPFETASSSPSPSPASSSAPDLATSTKIGIGIGVGVGIPLIVIVSIGASWLIFGRRRRAAGGSGSNAEGGLIAVEKYLQAQKDHYYRQTIHEMNGAERGVQELPSNPQ